MKLNLPVCHIIVTFEWFFRQKSFHGPLNMVYRFILCKFLQWYYANKVQLRNMTILQKLFGNVLKQAAKSEKDRAKRIKVTAD